MDSYHELGQRAASAFLNSCHFGGYSRTTSAQIVAFLFLPPVEEGETKMMIARPVDKQRAAWITGFETRRSELLNEPV